MTEKPACFFVLLLFLALVLRLASLLNPFLDIDEAQFALFAHSLMDGGLPYVASVDTKPPMMYLFFWVCFALFGKYSMLGVHIVTIVWVWATAIVIYKIAQKMDHPRAASWAAFFYIVFSTCHLPKFISTSITVIMVLPLALSVYFWVGGVHRDVSGERAGYKPAPTLFISGIFSGVAFLFKYQAGIQIIVFAVFLLIQIIRKQERLFSAIKNYSVFLVGFLMPGFVNYLVLNHLGVWDDFTCWSLGGSLNYIQGGNQSVAFSKNLLLRGGLFVASTWVLWMLAFHPPLKKGDRGEFSLLVSLWLLLSLIPVATGGRFYGHYFIQVLPPLCLLAAVQVTTYKKIPHWIWIFTLVPTLFFWGLRLDFKWIDQKFPDNNLFKQQELGQWIKNNTKPADTLFVWGYASAVYFHAERKPAARFLWSDPLTGNMLGPGLSKTGEQNPSRTQPKAWQLFWEDLEKNPPSYFVDTSPCNIHGYNRYPVELYPELKNYLDENYDFLTPIFGCNIYKKKI